MKQKTNEIHHEKAKQGLWNQNYLKNYHGTKQHIMTQTKANQTKFIIKKIKRHFKKKIGPWDMSHILAKYYNRCKYELLTSAYHHLFRNTCSNWIQKPTLEDQYKFQRNTLSYLKKIGISDH